jgi:hypothetical protein
MLKAEESFIFEEGSFVTIVSDNGPLLRNNKKKTEEEKDHSIFCPKEGVSSTRKVKVFEQSP